MRYTLLYSDILQLILDHAVLYNHTSWYNHGTACFVYVTIFITHQQMWVTDENNRRIIGMLGRIIGEIFKNCRIE